MNCVSQYNWKSQSLEMTHGNRLSLFLTFYEIYYPTRAPAFHATKEGFKALWKWCFSPSFPWTSGAKPVTKLETTRINNRGPKYRNWVQFKALRTWCFSPSFSHTSGAAPVTQPGTTRIHNRGPKYQNFSCIYMLNSFADTQSAHWNVHASYTNNITCQIMYTVSILVLKYATKIINLLSKGTSVRWSAELFWL